MPICECRRETIAGATESQLHESAGHLVANLIHSGSHIARPGRQFICHQLIDIGNSLYLLVYHIIMFQIESTAIICIQSK